MASIRVAFVLKARGSLIHSISRFATSVIRCTSRRQPSPRLPTCVKRTCESLTFEGCSIPGLLADGLHLAHDLLVSENGLSGEVRLIGTNLAPKRAPAPTRLVIESVFANLKAADAPRTPLRPRTGQA